MKRLVAITYKTRGFNPDSLSEWLFDNVGQPTRAGNDTLVAADHERFIAFNYATPQQLNRPEGRVRIATWGEAEQKEMWKVLNEWAGKLCLAMKGEVESESHELWEHDEVAKGLVMRYHALCPVEQIKEITVLPPESPVAMVKGPKKVGHS